VDHTQNLDDEKLDYVDMLMVRPDVDDDTCFIREIDATFVAGTLVTKGEAVPPPFSVVSNEISSDRIKHFAWSLLQRSIESQRKPYQVDRDEVLRAFPTHYDKLYDVRQKFKELGLENQNNCWVPKSLSEIKEIILEPEKVL